MEKVDFKYLYIMGYEIPTCPKCGSRTEFILDFSHTKDSTQVHKCLVPYCKMEFVMVADSAIN